MDLEIGKGKAMTKDESKLLIDLIETSHIITTKATNATSNKMKTQEWIRLANTFNATSTNCPRTPQQLRLKWENLKKNSRKRSTIIRMNRIKTGDGPPEYIPADDILDRVTSLLGSTVSGFTVPFGGDSERDIVDSGVGGGIVNGVGSNDGDGSSGVVFDLRLMDSCNILVSVPPVIDRVIETGVKDCQILDAGNDKIMTPCHKRLTFSTPRAVKKKFKKSESRNNRNNSIAEYYETKKQYLDAKLTNIKLENDNLKIRNLELKLSNDKLVLEIEKLKLELEKLKEQQDCS